MFGNGRMAARSGSSDLTRRIWTVSAERVKMDREYRVPLSTAAVAMLKRRKFLAAMVPSG